jgi:hypothetical protein
MTNTPATRKRIEEIGPADFRQFPIWTFEGSGNEDLVVRQGLPVEAVFPISYDLRPLIIGHEESLHGTILAEPQERLTLEEVRNLRRRRR